MEKNQSTAKQYNDQKNSSKYRTLDDPKSTKSPRLNLEKIITHENLHANKQNKENRTPGKTSSTNIPPKEENEAELPENNTIPYQEIKNSEKISIERDTTIVTKPQPKTQPKSCSEQTRAARLSALPNDHSRPINYGCPQNSTVLPVESGQNPSSKTSTDVIKIPTNEEKEIYVEWKNKNSNGDKENKNDDKTNKNKYHTYLTHRTHNKILQRWRRIQRS